MGARGARAVTIDVRSDEELALDAATGSSSAFEALYRRHSETAWRVAYAVTGNPDDASDAVAEAFTRVLQALPAGRLDDAAMVRSYLMSATRNAAIDISRRGGRVRSTDNLEHLDDRTKISSPTERVTDKEDVSLVARAFKSLPERWRSVLWLTEVEGIPPREAAALLGVTPNNAAQLAVRARAGLRERFVQAHLSGPVAAECRDTVDRLGAYTTGRLAPRELAKVDQHLAGCADCVARRDELEDVGGVLRRIVVPVPLVLGATALSRWKAAFAAATSAAPSATADAVGKANRAGRWADFGTRMQKPLMATATGIFAVGVIVAAPNVLGAPRDGRPSLGQRSPLVEGAQPAPTPPSVPAPTVRIVTASNAAFTSAISGATDAPIASEVLPPTQDAAATPESAPVPAAPAPSAPPAASTPAPTPPPASEPAPDAPSSATIEVAVAAVAGPIDGGIVLGDACQGGTLMDQTMGDCTTPEADADTAGVTITTGGTTPLAGQNIVVAF